MKPDDIVNLVSLIGLALPVVINLTKFIGASTHNKRLTNLANRADIIVKALDQANDLSNEDKKDKAIDALYEYANEVGIKVTKKQLSQYVEASVNSVRDTTTTDIPPEKNQRLN